MITVYGRMPVLEAVSDPRAVVHQVLVAHGARGDAIDRIVAAASDRGIRVERTDPARVTRVSRNGRHDQGVVADIESPGLAPLDAWLADRHGPLTVLLLDGLTNPANVGMIIRTAVAAGIDGVVLPRHGSPEVGPLVVKASAGVALAAPILRAPTAEDATAILLEHGVELVGLRAVGGESIWEVPIGPRTALVMGNETEGVTAAVASSVTRWCAIPLHSGVESLNVAAAATVACFEVARRRTITGA